MYRHICIYMHIYMHLHCSKCGICPRKEKTAFHSGLHGFDDPLYLRL